MVALAPAPAKDADALSIAYAPYGRLIPCQTVITLESSKMETPVIGLVTDDVWHNGRLVIPAGAEVHGRAALDRSRERIAASGEDCLMGEEERELQCLERKLETMTGGNDRSRRKSFG